LIITFYGVRGSIAAPGPHTKKYGGNTSCVHIELSSGQDLVLDAGTGIRVLGQQLAGSDQPIYLIFSHSHWDHIQGFPFFQPIYEESSQIYIFGRSNRTEGMLCSLLNQMDGAHFPVQASELPSRNQVVLEDIETSLTEFGIHVRTKDLNHPGGGYAYRIEDQDQVCTYVTDNELDPPGKPATTYDEWVKFCRKSTYLIHDAQYLPSDMPAKHGWGHSVTDQVYQLALDAEVENLILYHHDPARTDAELDAIHRQAVAFFRSRDSNVHCLCAWEGMTLGR